LFSPTPFFSVVFGLSSMDFSRYEIFFSSPSCESSHQCWGRKFFPVVKFNFSSLFILTPPARQPQHPLPRIQFWRAFLPLFKSLEFFLSPLRCYPRLFFRSRRFFISISPFPWNSWTRIPPSLLILQTPHLTRSARTEAVPRFFPMSLSFSAHDGGPVFFLSLPPFCVFSNFHFSGGWKYIFKLTLVYPSYAPLW